MPLYFRKSVKAGPLRFTFSKSGISTSIGAKGARLTTGPRGTYVTIGKGGITYRQRIGGSTSSSSQRQPQNTVPRDTIPSGEYDPTDPFAIKTADISELVAASDNAVLQEINERASLPAIGNWIIGLGIVFFFTIFRFGIFWTWLPVAACIVLGILIARGDKQNRTTPIFYDMDTQSAANYEAICESLRHLSTSQKIWRINAQQGNSDWKRNAGAGFLIKRGIAGVLQQNPPCIRTNIKVYGINAGAVEFYFLPDHILVRQQGKYAALGYDSVAVNSFSTSFIESEAVPKDAKQISQTWQYVNKKGGPDRRFNNNRQLPVMQYGELTIEASSGLNAIFHISKLEAATNFSETFQRLKRQKAFSYQHEKVR